MNENINLVEILKDCLTDTELYSVIHGKVLFCCVNERELYPIKIKTFKGDFFCFTKEGKAFGDYEGECVLFPSEKQRNWNKFKIPIKKFDPKTFQPFDQVLAKYNNTGLWQAAFVSFYTDEHRLVDTTVSCCIQKVIPYNEDTKYLIGTDKDCPEYYKWWKDN